MGLDDLFAGGGVQHVQLCEGPPKEARRSGQGRPMKRSFSLIDTHPTATPVVSLEQTRQVDDPFTNRAESARLIRAFIRIMCRHGYDFDGIRRMALRLASDSATMEDRAG